MIPFADPPKRSTSHKAEIDAAIEEVCSRGRYSLGERLSGLSPVSWHELAQRLRELGFEENYEGGRHPQMRRGDFTVIIPNSHEGDIDAGLLKLLLQQAGVSHEEWLRK